MVTPPARDETGGASESAAVAGPSPSARPVPADAAARIASQPARTSSARGSLGRQLQGGRPGVRGSSGQLTSGWETLTGSSGSDAAQTSARQSGDGGDRGAGEGRRARRPSWMSVPSGAGRSSVRLSSAVDEGRDVAVTRLRSRVGRWMTHGSNATHRPPTGRRCYRSGPVPSRRARRTVAPIAAPQGGRGAVARRASGDVGEDGDGRASAPRPRIVLTYYAPTSRGSPTSRGTSPRASPRAGWRVCVVASKHDPALPTHEIVNGVRGRARAGAGQGRQGDDRGQPDPAGAAGDGARSSGGQPAPAAGRGRACWRGCRRCRWCRPTTATSPCRPVTARSCADWSTTLSTGRSTSPAGWRCAAPRRRW